MPFKYLKSIRYAFNNFILHTCYANMYPKPNQKYIRENK